MKKKQFIFALVAMLGFTFSAFAQTTVSDADGLKAALEAGGDVTLGADITVSAPVTVSEGVTVALDLNGKKLKSKGVGHPVLENNGNLTINGSGTVTGIIYNGKTESSNAEMTLNGGTYNLGENEGGLYHYGKTLTINDGVVVQTNMYGVRMLGAKSVLNLYGGSYSSTNSNVGMRRPIVVNKGAVNFLDKDITVSGYMHVMVNPTAINFGENNVNSPFEAYHQSNSYATAVFYCKTLQEAINRTDFPAVTLVKNVKVALDAPIVVNKTINLNLNGRNLSAPAAKNPVLKNLASLTINGKGTVTGAVYNGASDNKGVAELTLNGGTYKLDGNNGGIYHYGKTLTVNKGVTVDTKMYGVRVSNKASVLNINGGKFKATNTEFNMDRAIAVEAGTVNFNSADVDYTGVLYANRTNATVNFVESTPFEVQYIEPKSAALYYVPNLDAELLEHIKAGTTLTLQKNIERSEIFTLDKALTLNGNGKTLSSTAGRAINVDCAGEVNISNLTIAASTGCERGINIINKAGTTNINKVNVSGVSYYAVHVATSAGAATVNIANSNLTGWAAVAAYGENGTINVKNSNLVGINNYTGNSDNFATVAAGSNVTVNVTGGKVTAESSEGKADQAIVCAQSSVENAKFTLDTELELKGTAGYVGVDLDNNTVAVRPEYAGDFVTEKLENGLVSLKNVAVASVDGVKYATVNEAINAAADGATVQLLAVTIDEAIAPWAGDSQHKKEKSITIVGAENFGTTLTGGMFLGYNDGTVRDHTITVKGINFVGKGIVVANQKNVVIEDNKFTNIDALVSDKHGNSNCAILVIGSTKDMSIEANVKNNEIENVANAGIYLSQVAKVAVEGNTVTGTQHNALTVSAATTATVDVKNNTFAQWGLGGEGRAMRISGAATVNVNENVMSHSGTVPEEFVKVTGATAVDVNKNYWNGNSPAAEGIINAELSVENYYTDAACTILEIVALEGKGTAEDPYLIRNIKELKLFRNKVNAGDSYDDKYIKLTDDIDLDNEDWTPIGTDSNPFNGMFDGNGKTISNLTINGNKEYVSGGNNDNYKGLFGYMKGGNNAGIKNLTIQNAKVTGCLYVGTVLGRSYTGGIIENCHVKGNIQVDSYSYAGGIVGRHEYSADANKYAIKGCTVNGASLISSAISFVNADYAVSYVGGIVGFMAEGKYIIEGCTIENITISGTYGVGGVSGIGHYGNEINSAKVAGVTVTSTNNDKESKRSDNVGLIVGATQGTAAEPTTFSGNTVENTTATATYTDGTTAEVKSIYGSTMTGAVPVTNYVAEVNGVKYETLAEALAAATEGATVTLLSNTEESIAAIENVKLATAVAGGVTVKNTYSDWINMTNVAIGAGVTLDMKNVYYTNAGVNVIEGTLNATTLYNANNSKTTVQNGGKIATTGMIVNRYHTAADAGIYVYGDGDASTVEVKCDDTIGTYSGTFYAKDADINGNMLWIDYLKGSSQEGDNYSQSKPVFENSTVNITKELRLYKDATLTLVDANVTAGTVQVRENATPTVNVDAESTIKATAVQNLEGASMDAVLENGLVSFKTIVAKIGARKYYTLETVFKAATADCTIEILSDVTVDYAWDARYTGGKFTVPVTINGNGKTIKFTNSVNDNNYQAAFRFEADATVNGLTVDMSEVTDSRFRAISSKGNLTVDGCKFIGKDESLNCRAIIFGEGAGANVGNLAISITNSEFINWKRGITDNENAQDVKTVTITGNTLTDAGVGISAKETVTFTGNTVEGAYVNIKSYTADNKLAVTATGNTLEANTEAAYNVIDAGGIVNAEGFKIIAKGGSIIGYTGADGIWGEVWGNSRESFVIKVLDANGNVMGTTSLNNVGGIINGNVNVTWNLKFNAASNTDEYWEMAWTTAPTLDNMPAKVQLWVDGTQVSEGNVVLNGPDNLNVIKAVTTNTNGAIIAAHTTFAAALAAAQAGEGVGMLADETITEKIVINKSITIDGNGKTLTYTGTDRAIDVPNDANANLDVTIKSLNVVATTANRGLNYNENGKFNVEGVTVTIGENVDGYAINFPGMADGAQVTIKDSKLTSRNPLNIWGENMTINVHNSEIISVDNSTIYDYAAIQLNNEIPTAGPNGAIANGTVVNVYGGTITATNEKGEPSNVVANATETGVVNISDETVVSGKVLDYVANIGGAYFGSLQAAVNAIEKHGYNSPIGIMKDFATSEATTIKKGLKVTINLNGKTITGTDNATGSFGLITNNGELTINGEGAITLVATNDRDWNAYSSVISNSVGGKLTVNGGTIQHLGGTDMAYGIDNLTNGKGTYAETIINGGVIKSTYRAIRQFLNGVEAQNILTVNGGVIEGANKSIWMQDPSKNANTGKLTVSEKAQLKGDAYLSVTAGSTAWPVEVSIAAAALQGESKVLTTNVPAGYEVAKVNGAYGVYSGAAKIGTTYYATIAEAIAAAKAGETVTVLEGTYAVPAMKAGLTIEGQGNVVFEGTLSGTLENLTMKNIHIKGGNAQRWAYAKGDLVFENVTFEATSIYALHFDGITAGATLLYKDCTIIGWAAMSGSPASCTFEGCTFKGNGTYGVIRTYFDATIENCTFDVANVNTTDVYQDGIHAVSGATVTVDNCTNANGDMVNVVNVSGTSVVVLDDVEIKNVAKIGDTYYWTLHEAVEAVEAGKVVTLVQDATGAGVVIDKDITIDFNGKTYTVNSAVGSKGTETLAFQILKDNNVTLKNGTIAVVEDVAEGSKELMAVIMNYSNLTLENMTIDGTGSSEMRYGLSTNNGDVVLAGTTTIKVAEGVTAIDVDGAQKSYGAATLSIANDAIVTVEGDVAIYGEEASVAITSGSFAGEFSIDDEAYVVINGGSFDRKDDVVIAHLALGYQLTGDAAPYAAEHTGISDVVTIVDGEYENFVVNEAINVHELTYVRDFTNFSGWQSLFVPFEIPVDELTERGYEVAYFFDVHYETQDDMVTANIKSVHFVKVNKGKLRANYPYVIRRTSEADPLLSLTLYGTKLYSTKESELKKVESSSTTTSFIFAGTYKKANRATLTGDNDTPCYRFTPQGTVQKMSATANLVPFRVCMYIKVKEDSPVILDTANAPECIRMRIIGEENEDGTTTIYDVEMDGELSVDYIYDLQGRRVLEPQKGGIYIINGKKVVF